MKKIKAEINYDHLRIYIDNLLHISVKIQDIAGIKSYKIGNRYYHIDFVTKDTVIELNYTSKELWEVILKELEKISII